ncbi:MAG: (2Fe-2S)-binding protein [Anaerolineae bacterium]|nr:(2Fe-2S)-binding protein [Anaerolineae bacterium]
MPVITLKDGTKLEAAANRRLVLALEDSGIDILHRCGGHAQCTTCRVRFIAGEPETMTDAERERLQARGLLGTARLSCQVLCDHDMRVEVVNRLSASDFTDPGPRPDEAITPDPVWGARPDAGSQG